MALEMSVQLTNLLKNQIILAVKNMKNNGMFGGIYELAPT